MINWRHSLFTRLCLQFFLSPNKTVISGNPYLIKKKGVITMAKKEKLPIVLSEIEPEDKLKYEVAEELGLLDKVLTEGWRSLTSKETGRIGGLITKKKRQQK